MPRLILSWILSTPPKDIIRTTGQTSVVSEDEKVTHQCQFPGLDGCVGLGGESPCRKIGKYSGVVGQRVSNLLSNSSEKKKSSLHCICHFSEVLDCHNIQRDRLFVKTVRRQDGADIKPRAETREQRVVESGVGARDQQCPLVAGPGSRTWVLIFQTLHSGSYASSFSWGRGGGR